MSLTFDFTDKIVLVTGGSQGIGNAIASAFRKAGACVHITGTRKVDAHDADLSAFHYHQVKLEESQSRARPAEAVGDIDV